MEGAWLAEQLEAGRSIESIAREVGRDPSTVAYWVNKHGLASQHAPQHAARGGIDRDVLTALVESGKSIRTIAAELDVSPTTVRHWLGKFDLQTAGAGRRSGVWRHRLSCACARPTGGRRGCDRRLGATAASGAGSRQ